MNIKLSFISIAFLSLSFNVAANEFEKISRALQKCN